MVVLQDDLHNDGNQVIYFAKRSQVTNNLVSHNSEVVSEHIFSSQEIGSLWKCYNIVMPTLVTTKQLLIP